MQPAASTEVPVITEDSSTQEVMTVMMNRIERLESKCQSQDLAHQMLKDSMHAGSNSHDIFDELTSRIVQSERHCAKQDQKMRAFEKRLQGLATCQSKTLKLINVISQKVNVLATISWEKTSKLDMSKSKAVSLNAIIENDVEDEYLPDHTIVAVEVFQEALSESEKESSPESGLAKLMRTTKPDGPLVAKRKSTLKGNAIANAQKLVVTKEEEIKTIPEKEDITAPQKITENPTVVKKTENKTVVTRTENKTVRITEQMYPTLLDDTNRNAPNNVMEEDIAEFGYDDNVSQFSLDSSILVEEYVMEKLEYLEQKMNHIVASKKKNSGVSEYPTAPLLDFNMEENQLTGTELSGTSFVTSSNPAVLKENAFRLLIRDTKAAWDLAFAELDKKVTKMNAVIEQMGTQPDDLHRRLSVFKTKVTHALEVISVALPESREDIITTIYDVMEDVRQDAQQVVAFEEEIRQIIEHKDPGTALTVSQIPTHLPELLQEACDKTTEVLGEKIQKYDLAVKIDNLTALLNSKVDIRNFITMEEEMRIALTLKADQKAMESGLDKKSSIGDAEKFREYVTDEIDAMRAMLATSSKRVQNFQSQGASSADFEVMTSGLNQRMDKLYKNMQETSTRVDGLVPRQEIETALQALLNEVKAVRGACVEKKTMEDRLQHKAHNHEVEKLLSILQATVGDPLSSQQAAIQKCLVCDKPVNPFQQTTNRPNSPTTYFDKAAAAGPGSPSKQRPQTTSGLPRTLSHPEKVRQTAEMNILRNSMELLPALDDSRVGSASGNSRTGNRSNNMSAHSRRIRSAAGGGLGPSYQPDSR